MKPPMHLWVVLCLSFLLAGCGIGGFWMEGIGGKEREDYLKSIKPYLQYWDKPGMTAESRRDDSVSCGATVGRLDDVVFREEKIAAARLPGEASITTYHRLRFDWQRCMLKNGYRFTGDCRVEFSDSPVSCKKK